MLNKYRLILSAAMVLLGFLLIYLARFAGIWEWRANFPGSLLLIIGTYNVSDMIVIRIKQKYSLDNKLYRFSLDWSFYIIMLLAISLIAQMIDEQGRNLIELIWAV